MSNSDHRKVSNKLIIMYFLNQVDLPLSHVQISDFILLKEIMDYFTFTESLTDIVANGYVDSTKGSNNAIIYTITSAGVSVLDLFIKQVPIHLVDIVDTYVADKRKDIKKEFETVANYFQNLEGEGFIVKCAVYDEAEMLMELSLTSATKEHARLMCENWRTGVTEIYGEILSILMKKRENEKCEPEE